LIADFGVSRLDVYYLGCWVSVLHRYGHNYISSQLKPYGIEKISKILPKSSNWRDGEQIELSDNPDEWAAQVATMDLQTVDSQTVGATNKFAAAVKACMEGS
jgi:hypothetical protein